MAYLIFNKNLPNVIGTLYRIAENDTSLNNLQIVDIENYNIITISSEIFDDLRLNIKGVSKYDKNNIVEYENYSIIFSTADQIGTYAKRISDQITQFLINNPNHPDFNRWSNYKNQLDNTRYTDQTFPLNKTLEQIYKDKNQTYFSVFEIK